MKKYTDFHTFTGWQVWSVLDVRFRQPFALIIHFRQESQTVDRVILFFIGPIPARVDDSRRQINAGTGRGPLSFAKGEVAAESCST